MAALEATRVEKENPPTRRPSTASSAFSAASSTRAGRRANFPPPGNSRDGCACSLRRLRVSNASPRLRKRRACPRRRSAAEEVWGVLEAAKAELAELRGVEGMLKQTREALAASEASEKALAERLAPLEEELASTKSRYESARTPQPPEKASLTARLDALGEGKRGVRSHHRRDGTASHRTQPRGIQSHARVG